MTDSAREATAATQARTLVRRAATATLATTRAGSGHPFASLVTVATLADGSPVLHLSRLAAHTRNLDGDDRASLLFDDRDGGGDPLTRARVTVFGRIERLADDGLARRRFLARHPAAAAWAGFSDFAFHRLIVEGGHLVAGFGRIAEIESTDLIDPLDSAHPLVAGEAEIVAALDADRARVAAWGRQLAGDGDWHVVGVDPRGVDLVASSSDSRAFARISLDVPAADAAGLRTELSTWENYGKGSEFT
ncbi:HugZ family pyridoxamine 5'-phosphate oxidase [Siculibacillus lacustris]|nr:pyridoxamine 5'-phosphate oxidase family protein [Siculibacillus lacustris]